jgi:hypothetical protein
MDHTEMDATIFGRLLERSDLQLEWLRHISRRLDDGERDFRALAVADATLIQQTKQNTDDIAEIKRKIRMDLDGPEGSDYRGFLGQMTELIRVAKEFVEAIAPLWKLTLGLIVAILLAKGIIDPDSYLKLIFKGGPG